jgi:hypothetical protein
MILLLFLYNFLYHKESGEMNVRKCTCKYLCTSYKYPFKFAYLLKQYLDASLFPSSE